MARDRARCGFGGALSDRLCGGKPCLALVWAAVRFAVNSPGSQRFPAFDGQRTGAVADRSVDSLGNDPHRDVAGELDRQCAADLLRAPLLIEAMLNVITQPRIGCKLPRFSAVLAEPLITCELRRADTGRWLDDDSGGSHG